MNTVVFHSFKGGVGRSLCLANVAIKLAQSGFRVGIIDLDLEYAAAGLHHIFDLDVSIKESVADYIVYEKIQLTVDSEFDLSNCLGSKTSKGCLYLIPGHIQDPSLLDRFTWSDQQVKCIIDLIDLWSVQKELDFVLLDVGAGLSNSYATSIILADLALIFFTPNRQHKFGLSWIVRHLENREISYSLVASLIPEDHTGASERVIKFLKQCEISKEIPIHAIPYCNDLIFHEYSLTSPNKKSSSPLLVAYESIASHISEFSFLDHSHTKEKMTQQAEYNIIGLGRSHLDRANFYSVFISYSHADKSFAKLLNSRLRSRGVQCWLDEHKLLPGDDIYEEVDSGIRLWDKVLLICSKHSLTSWWVDNEIDTAFEKERKLSRERRENLHGKKILTLIPLDIDGYMFRGKWKSGKARQIKSRLAADFSTWEKDESMFELEFEKLLLALRVDSEGREPAPEPKI